MQQNASSMAAVSGVPLTDVPLGSATSLSSPKPVLDLEWQSFPSSTPSAPVAAAPVAAAPVALHALPPASSGLVIPAQGPVEAGFTLLSLLQPGFYVAVFDIDTADVLARLRAALWPMQRTPLPFLTLINGKPDLYGPVWVAFTLAFIIGASSNLNSWFMSQFSTDSATPQASVKLWEYDFRLVTSALAYSYGYIFGAPVALWLLLNYLSVSGLGILSSVCLYGYSAAVFVPCALLCVLPLPALQWLAIVAASLLSALCVFKNVAPIVREQALPSTGRPAVLAAVIVQLAFGIVLKLVFYG